MLRKKASIIIIASLLVLIGCSHDQGQEHDESNFALIQTTDPAPIELKKRAEEHSVAYKVREEVKNIDEIYDVAVIEGKEEIIVAYKVKHLHRFKMKKIEKDLTKKLNDKYPEDQFIVSSDYKIFLEAIRLKEDLDGTNMSADTAEKRFKKIIKLKEEMT